MAKYQPNKSFQKYLESKSIVAVGYYDEVKRVNLDYLLAAWIDITQEYTGELFSDRYPYASDHFQVLVIGRDDPRNEQGGIVYKVVDEFRYCHHLKIWSDGELLDNDEIREIIGAMNRQRMLTEF